MSSLEAAIIEAVIEEETAEANRLLESMSRVERMMFISQLEQTAELALAINRARAEAGDWHS